MTTARSKKPGTPTTSSVTRRTVLKGAAATAAIGSLGFPHIAQAKPDTLVVSDAGGALNEAYKVAYYEPFTAKTGIRIANSPYGGLAKIDSMVANKAYPDDLNNLDATEAAQAQLKGLTEPIDYDIIDKNSMLPAAAKPAYVLTDIAGYVITWHTGTGVAAPQSWAEVWAHKGPKSFWKIASQTVEAALMADGVAKDKVYPIDIDRALKSLDKIRDSITWWESGAQGAQLLIDGETDVGATWNGRVFKPKLDGAPVDYHFNQAVLPADAFVIAKGSPNKKWAMELLAVFLDADRQAVFAENIPYGPVVPAALKKLSPEVLARLPTSEENFPKTLLQDFDHWASNGDKIFSAYNEWMLG